MKEKIFPQFKLRSEFKDLEKEPYFRMVSSAGKHDEELRTLSLNNEASNLLKYRVFKDFILLLQKNGFNNFIPLKGSWLFNTLFSDFTGLRTMADIDLLFSEDEFRQIPSFLKKNPELYVKTKGSPFLRSLFAEEQSVIVDSILVEMHSDITLVRNSSLMKEMFNESSEFENSDGLKFRVPSIEHGLMLMLLHDYSREDFADLTVKRLLEFYVVLYNCDMKKVLETASRHGLSKMLDCHLFMLYAMMEEPFFERSSFKVDETFGCIERPSGLNKFTVSAPRKLQKTLYGRKWYLLKLRNLAAAVFKGIFLRKSNLR